jgi:hypothetical protein
MGGSLYQNCIYLTPIIERHERPVSAFLFHHSLLAGDAPPVMPPFDILISISNLVNRGRTSYNTTVLYSCSSTHANSGRFLVYKSTEKIKILSLISYKYLAM